MDTVLPVLWWAAAALAVTGMARLCLPRSPHARFDGTHRAIGWLALASLLPALLGALCQLNARPELAQSVLAFFPVLWFAVLCGGVVIAIVVGDGAILGMEGVGAVIILTVAACVVIVYTLSLITIAARGFRSLQPGKRSPPLEAVILANAVFFNSATGMGLLLPVLLED